MVVGSTGKHYKVELGSQRRRCACVDHRIRRHDCKHIRLMLCALVPSSSPYLYAMRGTLVHVALFAPAVTGKLLCV